MQLNFLILVFINQSALPKDEWTMDELIAQVGSVDRAVARKALMTWVDLGVLKENETAWKLLERAEAGSASNVTASRSGTLLEIESNSPMSSQY